MKKLFIILSLLMGITMAYANNPEEQFQEANKAYAAKDYVKAAQLYQVLADSGYESMNLFFNLGNAYYKQNMTAESVLYFEKAKKLEPGNEDVNFNLKLANLRVADKFEPVAELSLVVKARDILAGHSSKGWSYAAILLIWVAFFAGIIFLFVKQHVVKRATFFAALVCLILSLSSFGIAYGEYVREKTSRYAIIFATNTYVKSAPDAQSIDLFILREGVKVELLENSGDWQKIKVPDAKGDKIGWLPKEQIREI